MSPRLSPLKLCLALLLTLSLSSPRALARRYGALPPLSVDEALAQILLDRGDAAVLNPGEYKGRRLSMNKPQSLGDSVHRHRNDLLRRR